MKNKKQKIALVSVGLLLAVSIITGLVKPYLALQNELIGGGVNSASDSADQSTLEVPNFSFTDAEDNTVSFDDLKGKPILINFWATWCGYCVAEMSDFNKIIEEYSDSVNFIMLDVVDGKRETKEKALAFLSDNGYSNIKPYFDSLGEGTYMFGINSLPTTVYVDKDGNLYDATISMTNYDDVKAKLDAMLKE